MYELIFFFEKGGGGFLIFIVLISLKLFVYIDEESFNFKF